MKIKLKKGDIVRVNSGNYRNKEGKILEIDTTRYRAFVEGVSIVSRHTKPNQKLQKGGIVKKEASVHLSKLSLIDPATGETTRIGKKIDEKTGRLVRYSKNSGEIIK
jgi:large subunit ribosomal protein L24